MTRRTKVTGARAGRRKPARRSLSLRASVEEPKRGHPTIEEILGLYKPRKKAITLRLDADVLDWFKKPGRGYQTRINRALRQVMREERMEAGK